MIESNTTKLFIDSMARSNNEPVYSFKYNLTQNINNVKSICITDSQIPVTFYNVNSTQKFCFTEDGTTIKTALISAGNYDNLSIVTALTTAIALVSTYVYTVTLSPITSKFTISTTIPFKIMYPFGFYPNINYLLGFDNNSLVMSTSQTANSVLRLDGFLYLYIELSISNVRSFEAYGMKSNFFKIPIDCTYGSVAMSTAVVLNLDYDKFDIPGSIQVRLLDPDWNVVDLNGRDYSFTLALETVNTNKSINYQTK